ncbi:hypothetical protein K457DRAFT_127143 [Linnemannia elongata AG-77]|uniref:Uncharacterized protein n=1 Tax=Linnemannia elongata AG-77 TaxID=1314771 RepID=A0A197JR74_9FUNG|nr:hypothetical protein K457DRAFT_127143 [Linnemannia elongata AG-77]
MGRIRMFELVKSFKQTRLIANNFVLTTQNSLAIEKVLGDVDKANRNLYGSGKQEVWKRSTAILVSRALGDSVQDRLWKVRIQLMQCSYVFGCHSFAMEKEKQQQQ